MPRTDLSAQTPAVTSPSVPRKPYEPPQLTIYGPVDKLTKSIGGGSPDEPLGESAL